MHRRWMSIALIAWTVVAALASYLPTSTPAASAAGTYVLTAGQTITGQGTGPGGVNEIFTWDGSGFGTTEGFCTGRQSTTDTLTIKIPNTQTVDATYPATITSSCGGGATNITVTNPNFLVPGSNQTPTPSPTTAPKPPANGNGNDTPTCDAGTLTWLICPVINFIVDVVDNIRDDILVPFLKEPPLSTTVAGGGPNPVYQIWTAFRDAASVFFILVFFLIIFGTAIGFDNYTIKKVLPHLIAGSILMPFSWYICAFLIDIGNVLGQGLFALASQFIPNPTIDFTSPLSDLLLGGLGAAGTLAAISLAISSAAEIGLGVLFTVLFAVLAALFTLVLRKILIVMFVILSPFAILAWILPNTQKIYRFWWTGLLRLILMYPLIMLLFEAGRIFALSAGTLITGGGQNPFTKAAVPFLQLLGLFLPLAATPWTFKWAGGAMAMGSNWVQRGRNAADNRFGRNSDWNKQRREVAKQRALIRSNDESRTRLGRAWSRSRAGQGGGFGSLGRGNELKQLNYQKALDAAYATEGAVAAINAAEGRRGILGVGRRDPTVPQESQQTRLAAEERAATNTTVDQRAARAGLVQGTDATGAPPSYQTRFQAQSETARRKESEAAGQLQSVVEGNVHPQSGGRIAGAALAEGLEHQADIRGKTTGTLQHEINLDQTAIAREEQRLGRTLTDAERAVVTARDRRVRFQTATQGTALKTSEEMAGHLAEQTGRVRDEREEIASALAAPHPGLTNTQVVANIRRDRTAGIVASGAETTRKTQAKAAGDRQAIINDANNPATFRSREQLRDSQMNVAEGKLGLDAGVVSGNIRGTQEAIDDYRSKHPLASAQDARRAVMATGAQAYDATTRKQILQAHGQNLSTIDNDAANPMHGSTIISGSRYAQAASLGEESGRIKAANNAAKYQARAAGVAAGSDAAYRAGANQAAQAARIDESKKLGKAIGVRSGTINADNVKKVSIDQYAEDAERSFERAQGQEAGETTRRLTAAREAEQELVTAAARTRRPITARQARNQLINNAATTKGRQAYIDTANDYVADNATMLGHETAIANAMEEARGKGQHLTRAQAESQIYANFRGAQLRTSANAAMGEAAEAQGVAEARAGQKEAARQEILKDAGGLAGIKAQIAARTGRTAAMVTDAEAGRELTTQAEKAIDMGAHVTAVKAKRDQVVKSTGEELGTLRALNEDANAEAEGNIRAIMAANPTLTRDRARVIARQQARQGQSQKLVSNKVGRAMRDTQEGVTEEVGADEGAISGEDKAIRQEMDVNAQNYIGLSAEQARLKARSAILTNLNRRSEREVRNARIGKAAEAEGVKQGRRLRATAVAEELSKRRTDWGTLTTAQKNDAIEEAIEGSSYRNKITDEGNKLIDSAAQGVGSRFGREDALREKGAEIQAAARRSGGVPPSDEVALHQARQENATNRLRGKLNDAEQEAGAEIGRQRGIQNINEAAIDLEQGTTLGRDHTFATPVIIGANTEVNDEFRLSKDTEFPHDVTATDGHIYKKGEIVPKDTKLKSGTTVPTGVEIKEAEVGSGVRLKAGDRVGRGSSAAKEAASHSALISRQTARRAVARKAVTAGEELSERTRAQEQGQVAALDRAHHEGTPTPTERAETYEQANLERIASETADVNAQSELAAEGRVMHRDMASMVKTRTELSQLKIIRDRVAERMTERVPWAGNVALKDVDLSSGDVTGNVRKIGEATSEALQGREIDKAIAYTQRMTKSDEGNTEFRKRSQRRRNKGGAGRTWNRSVDQSADPDLKFDTYIAEGAAGAGHVDSGRPMIAGAHNPKATGFHSKDGYSNGDVQAMLDYYDADDIGIQVELDELNRDIADPNMPEPQKAAARDQQRRLIETLGAKRWQGQGGRFIAAITDALTTEEKTGAIRFDSQVVRTLAKNAAFALEHETDDVGKTMLFNQSEAAKKARDAIIARAAATGITDWYTPGPATQPSIPLVDYDTDSSDYDPAVGMSRADADIIRAAVPDSDPEAAEKRRVLMERVHRPNMTWSIEQVYRAAGLNADGSKPDATLGGTGGATPGGPSGPPSPGAGTPSTP